MGLCLCLQSCRIDALFWKVDYVFGRKPGGFSDTKSGTGRGRSAAMGGWVLTRIAASSLVVRPSGLFCVWAVRMWVKCGASFHSFGRV